MPSAKANRTAKRLRFRLILVWSLLALAAIGLAARLFYLQVTTGAELLDKARRQQMFIMRPFIPRRTITDRKGMVLAVDRPVYTLFAHPHLYVKNDPPEEIAANLHPFSNAPGKNYSKF